MTIGLINMYSTRNLGDAAIYTALAGMCPEGQAVGVLAEADGTAVPGLRLVPRLPACTAYISVGGEIFNNARQGFITKRFVSNVAVLSRHASRTVLFGQTIPRSCQGFAFGVLATALKRLPAVVVRDVESQTRLRTAGLVAGLSYDAAFTLENEPVTLKAATALYASLGLDPSRTAILSLRGESLMYASTGNKAERAMVDLAKRLMQRGHQVAMIVQADNDHCDSDLAMCRRIAIELPGITVIDPFALELTLPAWSLYSAVLAHANIVVAARYHTAILRMISGRRTLVLHYSSKGEDLCNRLGLDGMVYGDGDGERACRLAERSAAGAFDVSPLAKDVREQFTAALSSAGAKPQVLSSPVLSPACRATAQIQTV
jgi:polysaccharide pyruvyl transferase WcaK-like protein